MEKILQVGIPIPHMSARGQAWLEQKCAEEYTVQVLYWKGSWVILVPSNTGRFMSS